MERGLSTREGVAADRLAGVGSHMVHVSRSPGRALSYDITPLTT